MKTVEKILIVVVGGVAVLMGVLMIINRSSLSRFMADAQRATFGKVGDKVAAQSSSGMTALVGTVSVLIGAAIIFLALTRR